MPNGQERPNGAGRKSALLDLVNDIYETALASQELPAPRFSPLCFCRTMSFSATADAQYAGTNPQYLRECAPTCCLVKTADWLAERRDSNPRNACALNGFRVLRFSCRPVLPSG